MGRGKQGPERLGKTAPPCPFLESSLHRNAPILGGSSNLIVISKLCLLSEEFVNEEKVLNFLKLKF
jgi:hypothetical protein